LQSSSDAGYERFGATKAWFQDGIEAWLQEWFAARGARPARDENYFDANAIDSFGVIEMIEAIEDHFKLKFRQHDFQDRRFATIAGLAEIVHERLQQE
jgi:acyl carrier protein